jgi:hypothetical protein
MACGILHIVRPLRPSAPVRPARRPRGRGRGGPPRPPLSPGRLLESVAGVRELVPHTGTPVPSCRGVGLVSRAGSPRQGALSAVVASVGGCAAGRPTPHTALVEESGSQRGSWVTHRRRAGGPGRAAGHGGVCGGCRQAPGAVVLAESPRAGRGSGTAAWARTPWRKGTQSFQARARKARAGTHRPHQRARHHGVMQSRPVSLTPRTTLRPASTGRRRLSTMMCDASRMVDISREIFFIQNIAYIQKTCCSASNGTSAPQCLRVWAQRQTARQSVVAGAHGVVGQRSPWKPP